LKYQRGLFFFIKQSLVAPKPGAGRRINSQLFLASAATPAHTAAQPKHSGLP
jgi:hypothetical protein